MSRSYVELPFSETRRRRTAVRALGIAAIVVIIAALVWARLTQLSSGDDTALRLGAVELSKAVKGDKAAFATARAHFKRAARAVVMDGYPVFVLDLTDQLEAGTVRVTDMRIAPVMEALQAGEILAAKAALEALPESDQDRFEWLARLLKDMSVLLSVKAAS